MVPRNHFHDQEDNFIAGPQTLYEGAISCRKLSGHLAVGLGDWNNKMLNNFS